MNPSASSLDVAAPPSSARLSAWAGRVAGAFGIHLAGFAVMNALAVWFEARPAPSLPDVVVAHVPYVAWVDRTNYLLWAVAVVPLALAMLFKDPERFCRYNVAAAIVAVLRGVCIALTGLGPVSGVDVHAGMSVAARLQGFVALVTLNHAGGAPFALTKDLFFSGHTATTFLLVLYAWRVRGLRAWALAAHAAVMASVFLAHLHYSIDVLGAYAVTLAVFAAREADWRTAFAEPDPRP